MKVRCIALPSPVEGLSLNSSPWVHIDGEYTVIGVSIHGRGLLHIVTDDDQSLAWFDVSCFVTVDSSIPLNWNVRIDKRGGLDLEPEAWLVDGFWESYYDDELDAVATVARELHVMQDGSSS